MRREVIVNGKTLKVELVSNSPDWKFQIERDDRPNRQGTASILPAAPGIFSVLLEGRSYQAQLVQAGDKWTVQLGGKAYEVEIVDPRDARKKTAAGAGEGRQTLVAPMPGKVVRVLVSVDEMVEPGQGLVVVEAMKMQNEMKVLRAGKVVSLAAREGMTVNAGDLLVVVE